MEEIMEGVDQVIDHFVGLAKSDGYTLPCGDCTDPGCCRLLVQAFPDEAHWMSEAIDKLPRKVRRKIDRSLAKWLTWYRRLPPEVRYSEEGYFEKRKRCPLLVGGRCAVYERRPVNCRCYQPLNVTPDWCSSTDYTSEAKLDLSQARELALEGITSKRVQYYATLQLVLCGVRGIGNVTTDELTQCFIKVTEAGLPSLE